MKTFIKKAAAARGVHLFSDGSLPTGVHWLHDIRRSGFIVRQPLCFDVGANVGQTVVEVKSFWPDAEIHAFEPFSAPFRELSTLCQGLDGTFAVQTALGAEPACVHVKPHERSVLNSLVGASPAVPPQTGSEPLQIDTIDSYCGRHDIRGIDVLKTDTEGYDIEVLRGAGRMLGERRVRFVYAEVTFCPSNRQNTPFNTLFSLLSDFDFRFLGLYETYSLHHFDEPNVFCNALFVSRMPSHVDEAVNRTVRMWPSSL